MIIREGVFILKKTKTAKKVKAHNSSRRIDGLDHDTFIIILGGGFLILIATYFLLAQNGILPDTLVPQALGAR